MGKIFKTRDKDNVFINIDDIVSIEENNGVACVYLKNFSDYIVLSNYEFQMLRDEIGFAKFCTASSGFFVSEVDGYKIIEWPDAYNNWKVSPDIKWSLKRNLLGDDSLFEYLFEDVSLQSIIYNEKTKELTCKTFDDNFGFTRTIVKTLSQGSFSLCSNYNVNEESYLFKNGDVFAISAETFNTLTNGSGNIKQIEYGPFSKDGKTYIMFNGTKWFLESYNKDISKIMFDGFTNVISIIISFDGDNSTFYILQQNEKENVYKIEPDIKYKLSSNMPSGEIMFDVNGIINSTESTIDIETEENI